MAIDGDGTLHVFYDMHGNPIRYLQSDAPNSVTSGFTKLSPTAFDGGNFTYPNVTATPNGDLYAIIRDYPTGELYHFDNTSDTWTQLATFAAQSGTTVYPDHVYPDASGDLHLVWEWAAGGAQGSRHYGSYARYDVLDDVFYRADGSPYPAGPIDIANADIFQDLEGNETFTSGVHGFQSAKMTLDGQGYPVVTYGYSLDGTASGYEHRLARWTGTDWEVSTVTPGPFNIDKSWITYSDGTLRFYGTLSPSDPLHTGTDDIFLKTSTDLGATWSTPVAITEGVNVQRPVGTTVGGKDYLYLPSVDEKILRVAIVQSLAQSPLTLFVDRGTGELRIANHLGEDTWSFDGYTISSQAGLLNTDWNSLQDQTIAGGWLEANPSVNRLSELQESSFTELSVGSELVLANGYSGAIAFGIDGDLEFSYTGPDGNVIQGLVEYTGQVNNLVLQIDPSDGRARLVNQSQFSVDIDGYTITSEANALLTSWNSLDDQNTGGGDWLESNPTTGRLSELKESGALTLAAGAVFDLGSLYNLGIGSSDSDVAFSFLINDGAEGESIATPGEVLFATIPAGLPGDYNGDSVVNLADYTLWRNNLGGDASSAFAAGSRNPLNTGVIDADDYTFWKSNFGSTALSAIQAPAAVPEPTTSCYLLLAAGVLMINASRLRVANGLI